MKMQVIEGTFGEGNPYVRENFEKAIEKIREINADKMFAFGIVCVNGDGTVSTTYDEGDHFHALMGGLSCLNQRMYLEMLKERQG